MFYTGQKIGHYTILFRHRVDETACVQDIPHGDYYIVETAPDEHVIFMLPTGTETENTLVREVEKQLARIRKYVGKRILI